jgi:hypothetical protein
MVRGDWAPWTDAAPVRAHVAELTRSGRMTQKNVADLAGVPPGSVRHLMTGSGGTPSRVIRPENARRLLAVQPPDGTGLVGGVVPAAGTVRRLHALIAIGWPQCWLADQLPMKRSNFVVMLRGDRVLAATAVRVRELYDRLWDQPPPQGTPYQLKAVRAALALAALQGWAPPWAWDDDAIDDPAAIPAGGLVIRGYGEHCHDTERAADYAELRSWGLTSEQAAGRLGVSTRTVARWKAVRRELVS